MFECFLMLFSDAIKEVAEAAHTVTVAHKRAAFESAWWHRTPKRVGGRYVIGTSQSEMTLFFFFPQPPIRQLVSFGTVAPGAFFYDWR